MEVNEELVRKLCEQLILYSIPSETIYSFLEKCQKAETGKDLLDIAAMYYGICKEYIIGPKEIYNFYIGWALPSEKACKLVVDKWKQYPNSKIVDIGAGTGLFCKVFNYLGIPEDKLLAVDIPKPSHTSSLSKNFWSIHIEDNFEVDPNDILFIAWGVCKLEYIINNYIGRGGKFIIILGEQECGATLPSDMFEDNVEWNVEIYEVDGPASLYTERLSINTRK